MNLTCPKKEALLLDDKIAKLAKELLTDEQIKLADSLSQAMVSSKAKRTEAVMKLQKIVGMKPKRPMYYMNWELNYLPRWTRNSTKYLGDYIDLLVKIFVADKLKDEKYKSVSLGANLKYMPNIMPEEIITALRTYNELIYVPAKHDFEVKNRRHRFTCREVVYACLITMELGKRIIPLSQKVKDWTEDKRN
ncbi:MAG: hypothetical protein WCI77_00980 [Candidatus Omnitrophota bacterium]